MTRCVGRKDLKRDRRQETAQRKEEIPAVLVDLNIDEGPLTTREFTKVKASLR